MAWIRKPAGPSYVTTLPTSPTDGQEIYYAADATNGVIWHLRYRSGSSSSYKWEYVGGSGLNGGDTSEVTATTPASSAWGNISSALSVTVPLAGDYRYEMTTDVYVANGGNQYAGIATSASGTPADYTQVYTDASKGYTQHAMVGTRTGVSASSALTLRYYFAAASSTVYRRASVFFVYPVRVG